jgi:hypothetical protein
MDQVFKLGAVNVVQFIRRNNLDIRHQEGWIQAGISEPPLNATPGHADLVQNITIGRDGGMIGFAAQHIDDPACLIPLLVLIGEQRAGRGLDDPAAGGVLLQRLLEGPHEQVALRPIIEDYPKPGVHVAVLVAEQLLHRRDIGFLAAQDVEPARRDLGLALKPPGLTQTGIEFLLHLLK